jgi:Ca2+-transporting ATPase
MEQSQIVWYARKQEDVIAALSVDPVQGLSSSEAEARLAKDGPNLLQETKGRSPVKIFVEQLTSTLVVILIVAAFFSLFIGNIKDFFAIMAIVVLNAILGFTQEYRAEKAMAALKKLATPLVKVRRGGVLQEISADQVVRGDIVSIEAGSVVPADGRLLESASLRIQEAILTGESEPIEKHITPITPPKGTLPLGDQKNMVFMGTSVTYGRGFFVVTETGMATQLGRVATLLQEVKKTMTPMQQRLHELGKVLAYVAVAMFFLVVIVGIVMGEDMKLMIMTGISMAVAVVPEGLPAVVTIALALGAQRMLGRKALIRKLPAVETLGSVNVICSDKTGTLTENKMTVTVVDFAGHSVTLEEQISARHHVSLKSPAVSADQIEGLHPSMRIILAGGALCNDALLQSVESSDAKAAVRALGDPTEGALVIAAASYGIDKNLLDQLFVRIGELPFDSERKRMSTVHSIKDPVKYQYYFPMLPPAQAVAVTKGAVDSLIDTCHQVWDNGRLVPLDQEWRERILNAAASRAQEGMRVLGLALRLDPVPPGVEIDSSLENNAIFFGIFGMIDPPRAEVKTAVETCLKAGIRPIMITGDHPLTARQIAWELGIASNGKTITGNDLEQMSEGQLKEAIKDVSVFARVSPEHKLKIIKALQTSGHVVSMTGDGVNDAPALKAADIGVAMGITGTDVSKEASDMVLLNDNFATIVAAVDEGRVIYENIRKFIKFSLAGNLAKVIVVIISPFLGLPLPFTPFQILWMNLVTDGLLGLGMSVDPADEDNMNRPPFGANEGIFSRGLGASIVFLGVMIGLIALAAASYAYRQGMPGWQTVVLTVIVFGQVLEAFLVRSPSRSVFSSSPFSNRSLTLLALLVVILQLAIIYIAPLRDLFGTSVMTRPEFSLILGALLAILVSSEIYKLALRRKNAQYQIVENIISKD